MRYRRAFVAGGSFFFTLVTERRRPLFLSKEAVDVLRCAFRSVRSTRPFALDARVVLPDHLHCIWTLPPGDADFSTRWRLIKTWFTKDTGYKGKMEMKIKLYAIFILFLLSQAVTASENLAQEMANKIVELSGMEKTIESFPEQIKAQFMQRRPIAKDPVLEEQIMKAMISSFSRGESNKKILGYVLNNATTEEMKSILIWLDSPLGRTIANSEAEASTVKGQANMLRYAADLQSNPPSEKRIELIQRFENTAKLTDFTISIIEVIMGGMIEAINEAAPAGEKKTKEELRVIVSETFGNMKPMMQQILWQQMLLVSHYAYRDISDNDIEKYIQFLSTDTGKRYVELNKGIAVVFGEIMGGSIQKLSAQLRRSG